MEPFAQDNSAFAFQKPFQPQGAQGGSTLKPFTGVDLAPQTATTSGGAGAPGGNPFLENFSSPFKGGKPAPIDTVQALENRPHPGFNGAEPEPVEDYLPVMPMVTPSNLGQTLAPSPAPAIAASHMQHSVLPPLPAAARQSQILAASELHSGSISSTRPRFFLTTTAAVEGFPIQAYLDVLSVEIVLPKDLLFRNPAPYGELHRLKAAEDTLQRVKQKALEELTEKGRQIHADGIVGLEVTFTNLDTVCCLCSAVGTAVKLA